MPYELALRSKEALVREFSISQRFFATLIIFGIILVFLIPWLIRQLTTFIGIDLPDEANLVITITGLVIGVFVAGSAFYYRLARRYLLTTQRVVATYGWVARRVINADYNDITDVQVTQDVFERIFLNSGTVSVDTAGEDILEIKLERVDRPFELCNQIRELSEERLKQLTASAPATKIDLVKGGV